MGRGRFLAARGTFSQKYKMSLNGQFIEYFEKKNIYPNMYIFEHFKVFFVGRRKIKLL